MRPFSILTLAFVITGCGAVTMSQPTVEIAPAAPDPASAESEPASAPEPAPAPRPARHPQWAVIEGVNARLQAASAGRWSIEIEPSGRVLLKDTEEEVEEEFYLTDISRVAYSYEASRPLAHIVQMWIKRGDEERERTRWRKKGEQWQVSTMNYVVLPFDDKDASDSAMKALSRLVHP